MRLPLRKFFLFGTTGALTLLAVAGAYLILPAPSLERSQKLSALVLARDGSVLRGFLSADSKWRLPVKAETVDPLYRRMLIATEDRRFASHSGVDLLAAARAAVQLATEHRIISGASTLTMQTVRLLEKRPRSFAAKLFEMAEALGLERRLGKEEIVGIYLSLAPFGGNLEGVRAASLAYLGKEPTRLSPAEAALLVAIPRSPERLRPDQHPEAARRARDAVLARMAEQGVISHTTLAEARQEAVPIHRAAPLPFHAPHLARIMRNADPGREVHRTTLDAGLQRRVEALLRREAAALDPQATLAALVVDNRRHTILTYVGNADFASTERRGTLDMAHAVRSPGSSLKPFIYALAFDRLLIHPETVLDDSPRHFGDYAPSDFDGRFQGEVSAADALRYSLNVPAVAVLDRLGPSRFTAALASAGIRLRMPGSADEPGLAIALGGVGVSLVDLATLYTGLAQGGEVARLRYGDDDQAPRGAPLFGATAAWCVTDILENAPAPPGMLPGEVRRGRRLAVKTGTSYGFRDAWAIGYDSEITIAVWVGRPDGTPMPGHSGRVTAAPVLFKIADLLGPAALPPSTPPGIVTRRDLPHGMRRLGPGPLQTASGPKILYPPDGATVAWDGGELPLEAAGGQGPLRWLVDGRPLPPTAPRRDPSWQPAGLGFVQLSVIDTAGRSGSATIRVVR